MGSRGRELIETLTFKMDRQVVQMINSRYDAMSRELVWMWDSEIGTSSTLRARWSVDEVDALCALNSFYQIVIGPMTASASVWRASNREAMDIRVGRVPVDSDYRKRVATMKRDFFNRFAEHGFSQAVARAARASDLVYLLLNDEEPPTTD